MSLDGWILLSLVSAALLGAFGASPRHVAQELARKRDRAPRA